MARPTQQYPWHPAAYSVADVSAIKAMAAGTATPEQQQRAMKWIIETNCGTYDVSYRPDSDRDTTFAEGKRFVGLQIVKLLKLDIEKIKRTEQ